MLEKPERTAEWVHVTGMCPPEYHHKHVCSSCDQFALSRVRGMREVEILSRFCPNCGAYMTNNDYLGIPVMKDSSNE